MELVEDMPGRARCRPAQLETSIGESGRGRPSSSRWRSTERMHRPQAYQPVEDLGRLRAGGVVAHQTLRSAATTSGSARTASSPGLAPWLSRMTATVPSRTPVCTGVGATVARRQRGRRLCGGLNTSSV